jgi:hypothetical protein
MNFVPEFHVTEANQLGFAEIRNRDYKFRVLYLQMKSATNPIVELVWTVNGETV